MIERDYEGRVYRHSPMFGAIPSPAGGYVQTRLPPTIPCLLGHAAYITRDGVCDHHRWLGRQIGEAVSVFALVLDQELGLRP